MIDFRFELLHFGRKLFGRETHKDIYVVDVPLFGTKNLESQLTYWGPTKLFEVSVDLHWWGQDHAGPRIQLELFGLFFSISIYDGRHWNYDAGRWYKPGEQESEWGEYTEDQLGV